MYAHPAGSTLTPLDGPKVVIDVAGLRIVVDPTFDPAQEYPGSSKPLVKTADATWTLEHLGSVDAVLLSHDEHPDNLDQGGRTLLERVPVTLTTPAAAARLGGSAVGLRTWETYGLEGITVTAVPAQHGPDGTEHIVGPVSGFVLQAPNEPLVYVSGDNASLPVVQQVADKFPDIDIAILFAGAARTPVVDGFLTLTSEQAVAAAQILDRPRVLPVHTDGWAHFTQDGQTLRAAFEAAGLSHLLLPAQAGVAVGMSA